MQPTAAVVFLVHKGHRVLLVMMELLAHRVHKVLLVMMELLAHRA
jgi:hypothetical protein